MSKQHPSIRTRKQHFPRTERRRNLGSVTNLNNGLCDQLFPHDDDHCYSVTCPVPRRVRHKPVSCLSPEHAPASSLVDLCPVSNTHVTKKARYEHNEQERNRRRELAIIYELIRCSFSPHDLRHLSPEECPRSVDRLSYPQVLHIAYHVMREEQHNFTLYERALSAVKKLENELRKIGLTVPRRPSFPSPMDNYRKVIQVVDNLLQHDKNTRAHSGGYEITPTERAAMGDRQLTFLRHRRHAQLAGSECYALAHSALVSRGIRRRRRRLVRHQPHDELSVFDAVEDNCVPVWGSLRRSASFGSVGCCIPNESHSSSDFAQESPSTLDCVSSAEDVGDRPFDPVSEFRSEQCEAPYFN